MARATSASATKGTKVVRRRTNAKTSLKSRGTKTGTASTTTNKNKKVEVRVHKSEASARKKKVPVAALSKDWPVASAPIPLSSYPPNASALRPGALLQDVCSGQDIHLNKQALVAPSLAKERGRFLLLLPGLLSLKGLAGVSRAQAKEVATTNASQITSSHMDGDKGKEEEEAEGVPSNSARTVAKKAPASLPIHLGRVEGLDTQTPKLRIPFPNQSSSGDAEQLEEKSLVFPGSKLDTTSKFMWLNCSTKKKGTVTCKSVFSSVIIFGAPKWEIGTPSAPSSSLPVDINTKDKKDKSFDVADTKIKTKEFKNDSNSHSRELLHYGGSDRTVDGIYNKGNSKRKKSGASSAPIPVTNTENTRIPIVSKEQRFDGRGMPVPFAFPAHVTSKPQQGGGMLDVIKTSESTESSMGTGDDNKSVNDSEDEEFTMGGASARTTNVTKSRSAPKRQASAKKTNYTADLDDSEIDGESDSDEENDSSNIDTNIKKDKTARRRSSETSKRVVSTTRRKSKASDKNERADARDSVRKPSSPRAEESDGIIEVSMHSRKNSGGKRKASNLGKVEKQFVLDGSDSGENADANAKPSDGRRRNSRASKRTKASPSQQYEQSQESNAIHVSKASKKEEKAQKGDHNKMDLISPVICDDEPRKEKEKVRKAGSTPQTKRKTANTSKKGGFESPVESSPFRSRRRKSPSGSATRKRLPPKALDLSQDSTFNF